MFGRNLDVTSYENGVRETHNPEGRAYAPVVWDYYNNGCSLRLLNPQTFWEPVWQLCATLQVSHPVARNNRREIGMLI